MIPLMGAVPPPYPLLASGLVMAAIGLGVACLVTALVIATRLSGAAYTLALLTVIPATAGAVLLPLGVRGPGVPVLQGMMLAPLLSLPLVLPLRSVQDNWTATARELGATSRPMRLRLLWWPLLKKPFLTSLVLALACGALQ
ncbi:hypothetical protein K2X14_06755 [Acetobacter sp. TBRC 12305]|uniref:ABC transporter permease n=1 Tax=Acetobacter garciniae TaxID=2817435 RepID=A0A939HPE0_9PROT|nr:hypothetical protein [Acetobacter garciniae]MBO1324844.1 hypothetical protein [Acetobacter garciniae]MBX0344535.1 hypothetical protein [Acetobacter garciniae]